MGLTLEGDAAKLIALFLGNASQIELQRAE
jgi:hypothetical protein